MPFGGSTSVSKGLPGGQPLTIVTIGWSSAFKRRRSALLSLAHRLGQRFQAAITDAFQTVR